MSQLYGIFAALGSAVSWAIGAFLFKRLGEKTPSMAVAAVKTLVSATILIMLILILNISFFINKSYLIDLILSGILGIAVGDSLFFASLKRLSPVVLSIILFAVPSIFYGLLGFFLLKEIPSIRIWLSIFLILSGFVCLLFQLDPETDKKQKTTLIGILFAVVSIFCTSISIVFIKPVLQDINSLVATMYRILFGGIFLFLFGILSGKNSSWVQPFLNKNYSLKFIGTVCVVTIGGFWLSLVAMKHCNVVVASTLMGLEPVLVLVCMMLFGNYKARFREYMGIFLALSGIISLLIYRGI